MDGLYKEKKLLNYKSNNEDIVSMVKVKWTNLKKISKKYVNASIKVPPPRIMITGIKGSGLNT